MKFGDAKIAPYTTAARGESPYAELAASFKNDLTSLFAEGRSLRTEAEGFVVWCHQMGEGSSSRWGATQEAYAVNWRERHRALAAKFKESVEARIAKGLPWTAEGLIDHIFSDKMQIRSDYTGDITAQARQELGL